MADTGTSKRGNRDKNEKSIRDMRAEFQASQDGDQGEPKKKKSLLKPLLLVGALLAVGGAGAGAWLFLQPAAEEEPEVVEIVPEDFEKVYIPTEPVHISFVQSNGRQRRLIVYFALEVLKRDENVSDVQRAMPRLQEAYWRSLNAEPFDGAETGSIELTDVKERVQAASDNVLGARVVNDVLIRDARLIRG